MPAVLCCGPVVSTSPAVSTFHAPVRRQGKEGWGVSGSEAWTGSSCCNREGVGATMPRDQIEQQEQASCSHYCNVFLGTK